MEQSTHEYYREAYATVKYYEYTALIRDEYGLQQVCFKTTCTCMGRPSDIEAVFKRNLPDRYRRYPERHPPKIVYMHGKFLGVHAIGNMTLEPNSHQPSEYEDIWVEKRLIDGLPVGASFFEWKEIHYNPLVQRSFYDFSCVSEINNIPS